MENTYFLPFHEDIPNDTQERGRRELNYYQVRICLSLHLPPFPNVTCMVLVGPICIGIASFDVYGTSYDMEDDKLALKY